MQKKISVEEMKKIQTDILKDVHLFCTNNKLRYTLIFGSLLGAIRHKGYIPWDDDIDIAMPRADYEKFVIEYNGANDSYHVYDYRKDADYHNPYAKVADVRTILEENVSMENIGINIDVFPFDYMFDTERECSLYIDKLNWYKKLFRVKLVKPGKKNSLLKKLEICSIKFLIFPLSMKKITEKEYLLVNQLQNKNAKYVALAVDPEIDAAYKSIYSRQMFENFVEVEFDGNTFMATADYDQWLTKMYGDYMTPPPASNRTSPHTLRRIYWL